MNYLKIVERLKDIKALVIGDVILDKYIWGSVDRISPEAPVPVVKVESVEYRAGGASNVASNLAELGCYVECIGVVGLDENAERLRKLLQSRGIVPVFCPDDARCTTLKTRVVAHKQQVVRIDEEEIHPVREKIEREIFDYVKDQRKKFDVVIVSDYAKGLVTAGLIAGILEIKGDIPVVVDPKGNNYDKYKGVTAIKPNFNELKFAVANLDLKLEDIDKYTPSLIKRFQLEGIVITLGEHGVFIQKNDGSSVRIPARTREVYDVSGAGDTFVAVFSAVLALTGDWFSAGEIANIASGIVVGKVGTAVVSAGELAREISKG